MKTYEEYMTSINEKANIKIAQRKRRKKIWASSAVSLCLLAGIGIGVRNVMPKPLNIPQNSDPSGPVSYTHLRAHETGRNLVCRLLLEKKKIIKISKPTRLGMISNAVF